jgi:CRP/FNR family transcriptional regulator, cyclic AMP receptor protein
MLEHRPASWRLGPNGAKRRDVIHHSPLRRASLLDLDPDLGSSMTPECFGQAQVELLVKLGRFATGPLPGQLDGLGSPVRGPLGLLVVDGLIGVELLTNDVASVELLGPGDLIRPWQPFGDEGLLEADVRWSALSETRLAVLDAKTAARLVRYPEIYGVLIERLTARSHRLAVTQTICQLNRVDQRVLTMLWHLAGRWGRVTARGTLMPLAIPHRVLSQLVGARRPTVSTACGELTRRGEVERQPDGSWLLTGTRVGAPVPGSHRFVAPRRRIVRPVEELALSPEPWFED